MTTIKNHFNVIDLAGKKFGKLSVIRRVRVRTGAGGIRWECICDCGKKHITSGASIRQGRSKSCGCSQLVPPNKLEDRSLAIWQYLYSSTIIRRSKKREWKCDISFVVFKELSQQVCFYCGLVPSNIAADRFNSKKNGRLTSKATVRYSGLDRVDSSRGYLFDNVVPCCKYCNGAKNVMTRDEFLQFIKRVYEYNF